jgi:hypothetical protein
VNASLRQTNACLFGWNYQWIVLALLYSLEYDAASLTDMLLEIGGSSEILLPQYIKASSKGNSETSQCSRIGAASSLNCPGDYWGSDEFWFVPNSLEPSEKSCFTVRQQVSGRPLSFSLHSFALLRLAIDDHE